MSHSEALKWAHEGRVALAGTQARFIAINSLSGTDCMNVYRGTEMLLKAVEIERMGTHTRSHGLVVIAKRANLWDELPPEHQATVRQLELYGPLANYPDSPGHRTLTDATSRNEADQMLTRVSSLFAFVENHIFTRSAP